MSKVFEVPSNYFTYRNHVLCAEEVPFPEITEYYGTPTYVYSQNHIIDAYRGYGQGLADIPHIIAFAVKANGNLSILRTLANEGAGADLTSGGELATALRGGISPQKMVFSGVGKTEQEIREGLQAGILMFNVESKAELHKINLISNQIKKKASISFRVNPNIDPNTHPKISTGLKEHKFGIPFESAIELYEQAASLENINVLGISSHIGSSMLDTSPLLQALEKLLDLKEQLSKRGIQVAYLDLGGGLGIRYEDENPEKPEEYASKLASRLRDEDVTLILEPGRSITGNAGLIVSRVVYVKRTKDKTFLVIDAAMNDLARPAIYDAYHEIVPVKRKNTPLEVTDVVGPICESSDVFGKERELPTLQEGDLVAICSAGAYGFAMASRYNGRLMPAEVMVNGHEHRLIRQRETYEDLFTHQVELERV